MSSSRNLPKEPNEHKNEDDSVSDDDSSTSENPSSRGRDRKAPKRRHHHRSDRKRKSSSKSKKRKRSIREDHDDLEDDDASSGHSNREEEVRRSHHHKRSRKGRDDDNYSQSSSSSSSSNSSDTSSAYHRKKKKNSKERKDKAKTSKKKKKEKKKRHRSKEKSDDHEKADDGVPSFGKFGILKASDYHKKQRSFTVWLEEVKGIMSFNGPKWELQNYFKDYMEDFNTATLPHVKYYDYDKWEMEEYQKNKATSSTTTDKSSAQRDAAIHMQTLQEKAKAKRQDELDLVRNLMNKDKREEMKRKAELQAQMAHAYKTGDQETYLRLKNRLEPER